MQVTETLSTRGTLGGLYLFPAHATYMQLRGIIEIPARSLEYTSTIDDIKSPTANCTRRVYYDSCIAIVTMKI